MVQTASQYVFDERGDYGPAWQVYKRQGTRLTKVTPDGFPHKHQLEYFQSTKPFTLFGGMRGNGKT